MEKELDLNKVNTALKVEFFDVQYKIGVLQKRLQYLSQEIEKEIVTEKKGK